MDVSESMSEGTQDDERWTQECVCVKATKGVEEGN